MCATEAYGRTSAGSDDLRLYARMPVKALSGEQFDAIWDLFDLMKLVEVVELPLDRG